MAEAAANQVEAGATDDPDLLASGFKIVPFGNDPVILVRGADGEYGALAATCTTSTASSSTVRTATACCGATAMAASSTSPAAWWEDLPLGRRAPTGCTWSRARR